MGNMYNNDMEEQQVSPYASSVFRFFTLPASWQIKQDSCKNFPAYSSSASHFGSVVVGRRFQSVCVLLHASMLSQSDLFRQATRNGICITNYHLFDYLSHASKNNRFI